MTRLTVGVVGHVDHGKTTLVRALTGTDTDRLAEEKARGISIALGFAHAEVAPGVEVDFIDMPGHEKFVRTMIAGATGIDAVLLVVATNEGVQPQTVEHIEIAGLLGISRAVVAVSKCDLADADQARAVAAEARALVERAGLAVSGAAIPMISSGQGVDPVRDALADLAAGAAPHSANGRVYLPIDRAFGITGHGPVVTGTLRGAPVAASDRLELWPERRMVRVRSVQVHGARVERAMPGQRVALNLRDVDQGDLTHGMALAKPDALAASEWLTIAIRTVAGAPPLKNGMRLRALFGAEEVDIRLRLLDADRLEPGATGFAQLHCERPVAVPAREHVILRIASPAQTVAGGPVLEPVGRRKRRFASDVLARLGDLRDLPPDRLIAAEIDRDGAVTLSGLSQICALSQDAVRAILANLPVMVTAKGLVVRLADIDRLAEQLPLLLSEHDAGLSRKQMLTALQGARPAALDEALARLTADGAIVRQGNQFALYDPAAEAAREQGEAQRLVQLAELIRLGGLQPPNPGAILTDATQRRAADRLLRDGEIIRAVDKAKGREMLFHREAIARAKEMLTPSLGEPPGLRVTEIGALLGISRKFSMPLLAHLDTIGFTRRDGDRRMLGQESHATGEDDNDTTPEKPL